MISVRISYSFVHMNYLDFEKAERRGIGHLYRKATFAPWKAWRWLSAPWRALPNFIIIGAPKTGTTSLFRYLERHPKVHMPYKKEIRFFGLNFARGLRWYRSFFPRVRQLAQTGSQTRESSPAMLAHPLAAQRVQSVLPKIKLIAMLRDPVERAFSEYKMNLNSGLETSGFAEAIEQDEKRIAAIKQRLRAGEAQAGFDYMNYGYLYKGLYAQHLRPWFDRFDPGQIMLIRSENFFTDPAKIYAETLDFLGLGQHALNEYQAYNPSHLDDLELPGPLRERLAAYFAPHNQELAELTGRDFGWGLR